MSSSTIKSINIDTKNKKVFITSYPNNVFPPYISRSHLPYFDKFFENGGGGVEAIQKDILFTFFGREFQGLSTNYGKAMELFEHEGNRYDTWQQCYDDPEFRINFENKLLDHFKEFEAKRKCKKLYNVRCGFQWILRVKRGGADTCESQSRAKKFNLAIAETLLERFKHCGAEIVEIQ